MARVKILFLIKDQKSNKECQTCQEMTISVMTEQKLIQTKFNSILDERPN